ncbi:MAG: hydroxyacid dehydrogenase [Clostridia bacterium]|nr:hydroxyacid dehydrogenase [Clostridia bacterium]
MKIVVLDAATLGDLDLSPLHALGEVTVYPSTTPETVRNHIGDADTVILNKVRLNESNLEGNTTLRQICIAATGYDNVDAAWCGRHGIAVCNVVGYSTDSVAQLTVGMALYLANRMPEYTGAVRDGSYSRGGVANKLTPAFHEVAEKTWGIAGYGNIGKAVGRVARALGCRVIVFKRSPEEGANRVDLDTLCRESDILSVHLPLNDGTRNLFSREKIALMKPETLFINVARGAVADEAALAEALLAGKLGGLGIDVYTREPFPEDHPFYALKDHPRACLTPHMAWGAKEARERCLREIIENIRAFRAGERRCRVD